MPEKMSSLPPPMQKIIKRDVKAVPYVELFGGRLQGVVSSGSDIKRVYVSYFEIGTLNYYCSTNNNRPCGGLRSHPCKHLHSLLDEAITQYGFENLLQSLKLSVDPKTIKTSYEILRYSGVQTHESGGQVFTRFLEYLQMLERPSSNLPLAEMDWFTG